MEFCAEVYYIFVIITTTTMQLKNLYIKFFKGEFKIYALILLSLILSTQFVFGQTTCTISSGTVTASTLNSTCPSGFTKLVVTGSGTKLEINANYTNASLIELSIEGSAVLEWTANKAFTMAATGNLYLNKNGGGTIPNSSPCNTNQDLFMGNVEVANCSGSTGSTSVSSFEQVNAAVGVNATGALPVDLLYFTAKEQGDIVLLEWETASELNSERYELYISTDAVNFNKFDEVQAAGNSNSLLYYSATVAKGNSQHLYFKLKQIDIDGEFEEFVTSLKLTTPNKVIVSPNPFREQLQVRMPIDEAHAPKLVQLINLQGVIIASEYLDVGTKEIVFETEYLSHGLYLLVVDGVTYTKVLRQ